MMTYDEIVNIEFPKGKFGGYRSDSVDDYIDDVAQTVKTLLEQIQSLNDKNAELTAQIQEYKNTEKSLHAALVIAQETASKLVDEATEKSESILNEAQLNAQKIESEAEINARELLNSASSESSDLLKKSKEKASEILREALVKANSITQKAKENCANEEAYYEDLKKKVNDFRTSMLLLYKSHVELLNEMRAEPDIRKTKDNVEEVVDQIEPESEASAIEQYDDLTDEEIVEEASEETSDSDFKDETDEVEEVDLTKISFNDFSESTDSSDDDL